jgi:hypothetical protein
VRESVPSSESSAQRYIPCRRGGRARSSDRLRARKFRHALYRRRRPHIWECARPAACVRRSILRVSRWSEHATCSPILPARISLSIISWPLRLSCVRRSDLRATQLVEAAPFTAGATVTLPSGRGAELRNSRSSHGRRGALDLTSSRDFYDTILVVLVPDGPPVLGSHDHRQCFAGFQWVAVATGTYRIWVASFESANTGDWIVSR